MKRYGNPQVMVTDKCPSYHAALKVIGNMSRQETGRHLHNRAENSYLPFRRRDRALSRFRRMRSLQKFASVHSSVHNHFNIERHLCSRTNFKTNRDVALREWQVEQMDVAPPCGTAALSSLGSGLIAATR